MTAAQKLSSGRRREQILKKATVLFARDGYEKVTIAKLAAACKISEPALYRYFKSKNDIYREVLKSLKDKINIDSLKEEISHVEDIEKLLFAFTRRLLGMYLTNPEITRLLLFCSLEKHAQMKNVFEVIRIPFKELLADNLRRLKRKKMIQPINPELTARCFTGMVTECAIGASLWKEVQGKKFEPNKIMKNTIPIFARGLKL